MKKLFLLISVLSLGLTVSVSAFVAESNNYRIERDSINTGGLYSASGNFLIEDTIGEIATSFSASNNYNLQAGYQQMSDSFIAISGPSDVTLTPTLVGNVSGVSNGQATFVVTTDNTGGYALRVASASSPALIAGVNSFADYVPTGASPDLNFTVGANQSVFGFSPEGSDVVARFLDNSTQCNLGTSNTINSCWDGFKNIPENIAATSSPNIPGGSSTTIKLRAAIGSNKIQAPGNYSATVVVTAIPL